MKRLLLLTLFLVACAPEPEVESPCELMRHETTGELACFGCGGTICKDPIAEFKVVEFNSDRCYVHETEGCTLKP